MAARINPSAGGKPDKLMRNALMLAVSREGIDDQGKKTKKLNLIASKLVDKAIGGDVMAIREINDRIDGKVMQPIAGEDGGPIVVEQGLRPTLTRDEWLKFHGISKG